MMTEEEEHQLIRSKGLEERNYSQAAQLMRQEQELKGLKMVTAEVKRLTEELKKKEKDENSNVLPFERPVPSHGGSGGSGNWLSELPEGAVFLSRKRQEQTDRLEQWHLTVKWKKGAILYTNSDRSEAYRTVDMGRFSAQNECVEILRKGKMETLDD